MLRPTQDDSRDRLDEFVAGEEVGDFKGGGIGSVGSVGAVVADAGAEIVANGAGGSFLGIGGAHDVAPLGDGAVGFEDHREDLTGGHEGGELAEEGPFFVDGVEAAGFILGQPHGFDGHDFEAGFMDARKNFTLKAPANRVGLDNRKGTLECHETILPCEIKKIDGETPARPYFNAAATVRPRSAGVSMQRTPAALRAAYLSLAVPCPPLMMAPAWPMRRPGGAVWPAMNPITGFFTLDLMNSAARSSALPPISPMRMMRLVSGHYV